MRKQTKQAKVNCRAVIAVVCAKVRLARFLGYKLIHIGIIYGACGDDRFSDFREWVIGQGKDFYYKTIKNPQTLINLDENIIN